MKKTFLSSSLLVTMYVFSSQAISATVSASFSGNDCAGYFGDNFGSCAIFIDVNGDAIQLSPVIAKYEVDNDGVVVSVETNGLVFPSVDGDEFALNTVTESWDYNPGVDDPGVRYWAAKGGNGFNLFWEVDELQLLAGGACDDSANYFTIACLNEALVVDMGGFSPPAGTGLSHLTFYDSDSPIVIPLPASAWLMGAGLMGLVGIARRGKSI